jgi:hypothetical protein
VWINVPTNSIRPRCRRPVRSVARSAVRSLSSPRVRQRCAILSRPLVSKKKKFETEEKTGKSADETRKQRKYGDCAKYKSHTETERRNRNRRPNECVKSRNVGILIHTFNEAARPNIRSTHSMIIFGTHESLAFGRTGKRSRKRSQTMRQSNTRDRTIDPARSCMDFPSEPKNDCTGRRIAKAIHKSS